MMTNQENEATLSHNDLIEMRRAKMNAWREETIAFPTDFRRDAFAAIYSQIMPIKPKPNSRLIRYR